MRNDSDVSHRVLSQPGDVLDYRNARNKRIAVPSLITVESKGNVFRQSNLEYLIYSIAGCSSNKKGTRAVFLFNDLGIVWTRYISQERGRSQQGNTTDEQSGIIIQLVDARYLVGGERRLFRVPLDNERVNFGGKKLASYVDRLLT